MNIATQTEKTETKSVAKDTANGLTRAVTELKVVKIMITTKKKRGLTMPEYIERETVVTKVKTYIMPNVDIDGSVSIENAERYFLNLLAETPAADVAEVKHGKWETGHYEGGIFDGMNFEKCSVCQFERLFEDVNFKTTFNYCPHCGAKMDQKEGVEE